MKQLILLALFSLQILNLAYGRPNCDCDYHNGGCTISNPAPQGYKCRCKYKGFWTCSGTAHNCRDGENCPGGRSSYCACKLGGGDCGGYNDNTKDCSSENQENSTITIINPPDCDCDYHSGGCLISEAAPKNYKCVCVYKGGWSCSGWAQGCSAKEYCPGGLDSYCGCKQGGGDCGAYDEDSSDPEGNKCNYSKPKPKPKECNCRKNSDWRKSSYRVTKVNYDMKNVKRSNIKPVVLGIQEVPNKSNAMQTILFMASKSLSSTSSFKHTSGISLSVGTTFTAKFPLNEVSTSFTVDISTNYEWGKSNSVSMSFSHSFTCNGPPWQKTRCEVSVQRADVRIPYTMTLTHNKIPNCKCKSKGIWKGVTAYDQTLQAFLIKKYKMPTV